MARMLVYFIKIARRPQSTIWQRTLEEDVKLVINPDDTYTRYGKPWRFSQPKILSGYFVGKLGFTSRGVKPAFEYDDKEKDYVERFEDSKETNMSYWALDFSSQILAFEAKPPHINYQAFRGALGKFFIESPDAGLTIQDFVQQSKFASWVKEEVERVFSFHATMRVPNPDWTKVPKEVRKWLQDTNADTARIELEKTKDSEDGLDTGSTINEIVKYGETGYSSIIARGKVGDQTKIFNSSKRIPSRRIDTPKELDDEGKWGLIIDTLRKFVNEKTK